MFVAESFELSRWGRGHFSREEEDSIADVFRKSIMRVNERIRESDSITALHMIGRGLCMGSSIIVAARDF